MQKPNNYDNVQPYGEFKSLEIGGHICKIMQVKEVKSKSGKDMIAISLDIAEGEQKDYFKEQWNNNKRKDKKWGCIVYQLVLDSDGNASRGLKTFHTSVEESNSGFGVVWGDNYAENFKGKLIGGIFGREQYQKQDGKLAFSVKCQSFRSVKTIRKGVEPPEDKLLDFSNDKNSGNNFYYVDESIDDDNLPF